MPRIFRRSSSGNRAEGEAATADEELFDVTDRSKLNRRALRLLESELADEDRVQAIIPAGGSAIVALDHRLLVLHTGVMSKPVAWPWDVEAVTAIYTKGIEVALYGPSLEEAQNVWLPGDSTLCPVPLNSAANAVQTGDKKEAAAAIDVMRQLLPNRQEPDWSELRVRRKARAEASKAEKRAAADITRAGLSAELFNEYRSQSAVMKQAGIGEKDLLELYQSIYRGDLVIVRKYLQLRGGAKGGMRAFQAEANLLAGHGYTPTTQGFAANNALTGISVGSGEIIVSYSKRASGSP